jgi:hypothetical protein
MTEIGPKNADSYSSYYWTNSLNLSSLPSKDQRYDPVGNVLQSSNPKHQLASALVFRFALWAGIRFLLANQWTNTNFTRSRPFTSTDTGPNRIEDWQGGKSSH